MKSISNLFILFFILLVLGILYKRFEDKMAREESSDIYESIQKYLLDDDTLGKSKKPILWIHVPYEYNSRNWLSFGSRSSFDLNQPYLYLTVRSIIKNCDKSFTICIIDDTSFKKLIPGWNINMTSISDPILSNMRMLGMMKLLYIYGGMHCPISFLCLKDLNELYIKGTRGDKMFVCETVDRNITSTDVDFYPNLSFCGAPKECETVRELCNFIQRTASHDYTADTKFLGEYDKWSKEKIHSGKINMIIYFLLSILLFIILSVAITIRRFHDLNRSGYHTFLLLIPLVRIIISLILFARRFIAGPCGALTLAGELLFDFFALLLRIIS
jgi:uncharacterized membrane protein YhaH (DUF805 family)